MEFEIVDKRAEKRAAEAAVPVAPSALEVVKDRMDRAVEALANGDMDGVKAVESECSNPPRTYGNVVEIRKKKDEPAWKSVGFVVAMLPMGQATIMMMRAVGLRESGLLFTADYAIPGMVEEGEDFVAAAKYRLDTFKICACDRNGRCKFHGEMLPGAVGPGKWLEEDIARLKKQQAQPMPEAVEVLMKAEAARANQRIVVPGRP